MDTRVSLQSVVQNTLANTNYLTDQLASLQTQEVSGQKFNQISDDPGTALVVLDNNELAQNYSTDLSNISAATSQLNASVSTLQQMSDVFTQAQSIAIQSSNSTSDTTTFEADAQQVGSLLNNLISLANAQNADGTYMFGGTAERQQPFAVTSTDAQGLPQAVQYQGSANATNTFVDSSRQVAVNYSGGQILDSQQRQPTVFTGSTGAQPGGGTDSGVGNAQLVLSHTTTTYAGGSGVQAGTNSAAGDTILGASGQHTLQIDDTSGDGSSGTVSLDGGPAVAFTNQDTNLEVTNAAGGTVYLNTTAITPNFNGSVDITSNGTMSIDGGATSVPITFSAGQSVTNSTNGQVTSVDTSAVTGTGMEQVTYPGTNNAFQSLISLRDDLLNTRQLSSEDQIKAISNDLADINRSQNQILNTVGAQSATLQSLQTLQGHLQSLQLNAQQAASDLGGADISNIVVQLQSYQNMLQLTLYSFSQMTSQSLLNFLK